MKTLNSIIIVVLPEFYHYQSIYIDFRGMMWKKRLHQSHPYTKL